jgi:hypothetical protein
MGSIFVGPWKFPILIDNMLLAWRKKQVVNKNGECPRSYKNRIHSLKNKLRKKQTATSEIYDEMMYLVFFGFTPKQPALRRKNNGWLRIRIMCPSGAMCLSTDCCFSGQ